MAYRSNCGHYSIHRYLCLWTYSVCCGYCGAECKWPTGPYCKYLGPVPNMANCGRYSIGIYIYGHIPLAVVTVERIVNGLQVLVVNTLDLYPIWPTVAVTL